MSNKIELQNNNIDLETILTMVNELPDAGIGELPTLSNPATENEVAKGYEFLDSNGEKKIGTATTCFIGEVDPDSSFGSDGDIYIRKE